MENKNVKYVLIGITVWIVLQIPRLIAIPIIQDVLSGVDEGEWMYPAILDIVVATLSPIALYVLWKKPDTFGWTFLICYFVISILDHGDAVTAASLAPVPQTFAKMGAQNAGNAPAIQSVLDVVCIFLLCRKSTRVHFNLNA